LQSQLRTPVQPLEPLHIRPPAHSLAGSLPEAIGKQKPGGSPPASAPLHVLHNPVQAFSQHTPSTQNPLVHW
jgi:hypothetical protein